MAAVSLGSDNSETQLDLQWTELTGADTGNSEILGYQVYWDAGSSVADIELLETTALSYVQINLTPGQAYLFKIRARNIYGYGDFSEESTFTPVNVPSTMEPVTTVFNFPNIDINFVEPDDSGSPVLTYQILFYDHALASYREVTSLCDGADQTVIDAMSCTVSIADLITELSYSRGDVVYVKAAASNTEGFGALSSPNTSSAEIQTVPAQMSPPTITALTMSSIALSWDQFVFDADTGASPIVSYSLEWDQGADSGFFSLLGDPSDSLALTWQIDSGLSQGEPYQFRVRAKNTHGWGDYSDVVTAIPASPPGKPDAVTVEIDNIYVKISWDEPLLNGAAIDAYKVIIVGSDGLTWAEASTCDGTD
jgi:titin